VREIIAGLPRGNWWRGKWTRGKQKGEARNENLVDVAFPYCT
jgi:hypothetical protein